MLSVAGFFAVPTRFWPAPWFIPEVILLPPTGGYPTFGNITLRTFRTSRESGMLTVVRFRRPCDGVEHSVDSSQGERDPLCASMSPFSPKEWYIRCTHASLPTHHGTQGGREATYLPTGIHREAYTTVVHPMVLRGLYHCCTPYGPEKFNPGIHHLMYTERFKPGYTPPYTHPEV